MRHKLIDRFEQQRACSAGAQFALYAEVVQYREQIVRIILLAKIVAHYEDDVNVVRVGLSGDVTSKDNETFELASVAGEFINA
jgi:hypothetical protein